MIRQTGETYQSSRFSKALFLAEGKVGKTSFLAASALGVLPWQKSGGIISKPENLHVIAFDASALGGLNKFLTQTCGASNDVLKFNVYNFQDDARKVATSDNDWDFTLFNQVSTIIDEIQSKAARGGTHVMLFSSLTGLCQSIQRALQGPFAKDNKKGTGMDQSKWAAFSTSIAELRSKAQLDNLHTWWEAHVYVTPPKDTGKKDEYAAPKESLQIDGKTGQNFAYNVEQVFRIRRRFGKVFGPTKCDEVYLDTQPNMEVVANGRGFTENLAKQEPCLTAAFKKLGLTVGGYGAKAKVPKPLAKAV